MKKGVFLTVFVMTFMLCLANTVNVNAWVDLGPFTYWYSDNNGIGDMSNSTIYVYTFSSGAGFGSQISTLVNAAKTAWSSEGTYVTGSSTNCNIFVTDMTRLAATLNGVPFDADAYTEITDMTLIGHATVTGLSGRKSVYAVERASISLIYDSITGSYSTNKLKALTTHEFGHALGYFGHDINSTNVNKSIMNPYIDNIWDLWSVNAPTSRDLNHMGNI